MTTPTPEQAIRERELATIFDRASKQAPFTIDEPFGCVPVNIRPATCIEIRDALLTIDSLRASEAALREERDAARDDAAAWFEKWSQMHNEKLGAEAERDEARAAYSQAMRGLGDANQNLVAALTIATAERDAAREALKPLSLVMAIVDRHAESKEGSGLLYLPVMPREMKELRSALEPFRAPIRAMRTKP